MSEFQELNSCEIDAAVEALSLQRSEALAKLDAGCPIEALSMPERRALEIYSLASKLTAELQPVAPLAEYAESEAPEELEQNPPRAGPRGYGSSMVVNMMLISAISAVGSTVILGFLGCMYPVVVVAETAYARHEPRSFRGWIKQNATSLLGLDSILNGDTPKLLVDDAATTSTEIVPGELSSHGQL